MKYKLINEDKQYGSLLYQVLYNRGITDPEHYLNTTDADIIPPSTIKNMHEAAQCLIKHLALENDIFINVDSDCDGYTSAAFMINWLYRNFPGFTVNHVAWGMHHDKGHGLLIDQILTAKPQLVICPDAGSNEFAYHTLLKEHNIDLIIIDHHNTDKYSEDAIVINNQLDKNYPTKSLSGVGMVYKFCSYFDELGGNSYANDLLDIATLGIIADVMELKDYETRRIVDKGLINIENPFIKAMVAKNEYSLGTTVTPTGVAWYIAPAVNAITRVGTEQEKQILFEALLDHKAYTLVPSIKRGHKAGDMETIVEQAVRTCVNVKKRQDKSRDSMTAEIDEMIVWDHLLDNKILIVPLEEPTESSRSITGLIANKLMSAYGHPVMLLNKTYDEDGKVVWAGSGRNNPSMGLPSLQQFALDSGYFTLAQGHDNALGLAIPDENLQAFINYSNEELKDVDFSPVYAVDGEFYADKIDGADILNIADQKSIWGQGVDEPLIAIKNISITKNNINLFGSTLKIMLPDNIALVKFKSSQEEFDTLYPGEGCNIIEIVGRCMRNSGWDDGPEIIIEDYNITRKLDFYF